MKIFIIRVNFKLFVNFLYVVTLILSCLSFYDRMGNKTIEDKNEKINYYFEVNKDTFFPKYLKIDSFEMGNFHENLHFIWNFIN